MFEALMIGAFLALLCLTAYSMLTYGKKWRGTREPLDVKEESEKTGLKFNIQKTLIFLIGG